MPHESATEESKLSLTSQPLLALLGSGASQHGAVVGLQLWAPRDIHNTGSWVTLGVIRLKIIQ